MSREQFEFELVASGFSFTEGPRWRDGRLYTSDMFNNQVVALDSTGEVTVVCEVPGQPSGLGFAPDGALLVVSQKDRRVMRWTGSELTAWADLSDLLPFMCNDMIVDGEGRAYVGNFGWDSDADPAPQETAIALVQPDGTAAIAAEGLIFPNGMAISEDGGTLYVAETYGARISAFAIAHDGSLNNHRIWASFANEAFGSIHDAIGAGVILPDGITLDAEGALWVGDAAGRSVVRVAEGGEVVDKVETGALTPYAAVLGGPDRRTLFICASTPLLEIEFPFRPGVTKSNILSARVSIPGAGRP